MKNNIKIPFLNEFLSAIGGLIKNCLQFIYNNTVLKIIQFFSQIYNYCNKDQETYALKQEECHSDSMDQTISYQDKIETQLHEDELKLLKDIDKEDNMERNFNNLQALYNSLHNRHAGNIWVQLLMKIIEQHPTQESFLYGLYSSFHNQYYGNYTSLMPGETRNKEISYEYEDTSLNNPSYDNMIKQKIQEGHDTYVNLTQAKVKKDNTDLMQGERPKNTISYEYYDPEISLIGRYL